MLNQSIDMNKDDDYKK